MKKILFPSICFLSVVALASCSNTKLEERISTLEEKVAKLEGGSTTASNGQPMAMQNVSQDEDVAANTNGASSKFEFAEMEHDFGTINEGDIVEHTFSFKNVGEAPLVIQSASASCGCTVPKWPKEPIPVGESGEIKVQFNSTHKPGIQNKTVRIVANTQPSTTMLKISSNVTPKAEEAAGPVRK